MKWKYIKKKDWLEQHSFFKKGKLICWSCSKHIKFWRFHKCAGNEKPFFPCLCDTCWGWSP